MGRVRNKIIKLVKKLFRKKEEPDLPETLFSIVKALKKEEKKILKATYPNLKSPVDLEVARVRAKRFLKS